MQIETEKIDKRRDRTYGMRVTAIALVPGYEARNHAATILKEQFNSGVKELAFPNSYGNNPALRVARFYMADRPSKIMEAELAITEFKSRYTEAIEAAVAAGVEHDAKVKHALIVAQQATAIANWIADESDEKARAVIRFKQRLAALTAELEAEQQVQLAEMLSGSEVVDVLGGDERNWDPAAVTAAKALAKDRLPRPITRGIGHGRNEIKADAVQPFIEAARSDP